MYMILMPFRLEKKPEVTFVKNTFLFGLNRNKKYIHGRTNIMRQTLSELSFMERFLLHTFAICQLMNTVLILINEINDI